MRSAMLLRLASIFALGLAVAGCGESAPVPAPRIVRFTASPARIPVEGGPVILMWDVADASYATLEDHQALPTSGSVQVFVDEDASFTVTAHGADAQTASATISVKVERLEVSGTVVDEAGRPAAGIEVSVNGAPPVVSADDGTWSGGEGYSPWSVRVHDPSGSRVDQLFLGITTKSAVVPLGLPEPTTRDRRAFTLKVDWSEGLEAGPDTHTDVIILGTDDVWSTRVQAGPTGTIDVPVELAGAAEQDVDVVLLQGMARSDPGTLTTASDRFAWVPNVSLSIDEPLDLGTLPLQAVPSQSWTLSIQSDTRWIEEVCTRLRLKVPGRAPWVLPGVSCSNALELPLELVSLPFVHNFELSASAQGAEVAPGSGNRPRSSTGFITLLPEDRLSLTLASPPELLPGPVLTWRAHAPYCRLALDGPMKVDLWTDRTELSPKLLSRAGLELTPGDYMAQLSCFGGPISIDEVMANPSLLREVLAGSFGAQHASSPAQAIRL